MAEMVASPQTYREGREEYSNKADYDGGSSILSTRDSFFTPSTSSSRTSAARSGASSASNYRFEHNRRYHAYRDGHYLVPNDQQEQDRMDVVHQMMYLLLDNELHLSPLKEPRRILDVGTGTGVWAIEMAFKYPNARVIGNDLSPIQVSPPPNCSFDVEDAESDWLYPTNNFDFIHTRQLLGGITNWPRFFQQAYDHIRPGGWLELQETPANPFTDTATPPPSDLPIFRVLSLLKLASLNAGRAFSDESFKSQMEEAGFVDVQETRFRIPLGPWERDSRGKEVGRYNMINFMEGLEGYSLALFTRVLGMEVEKVRELIEGAKRDGMNRKLRIYFWLVVVRGRKPEAPPAST
ncbi:S-adenosyl-L-methionine-dependent methyltransferase [Morchella conica CCBAS932]|uniref:S-adenosyl-L-methionine-dependent methyltransferase n=1 Tax=Morchella conica CCBAS932 TaxID=1392247 RepID=A0A3N4KC06_9PEZI|nr:S-adenosyl-L-methionine-dependent methyltransferase [Morchella conica CCBAS932]